MKEFVSEYWLGIFFTAITTLMGYFIKRLNKKMSEQESIKLGVQALLRDRIIEKYDQSLAIGYCPVYIRESVCEMEKQYKNLGGNGVVPSIVEKLYELPTSKPNED